MELQEIRYFLALSNTRNFTYVAAECEHLTDRPPADFVSFTKGTIDSGVHWIFAGSSTIDSSVTLTESGVATGTFVNAGWVTDTMALQLAGSDTI